MCAPFAVRACLSLWFFNGLFQVNLNAFRCRDPRGACVHYSRTYPILLCTAGTHQHIKNHHIARAARACTLVTCDAHAAGSGACCRVCVCDAWCIVSIM